MRVSRIRLGVGLVVGIMIIAGCASPERHARQQAPLYELNEDVAVALVQVSELEGVRAGDDTPEMVWDALQGALEGTQMTIVDRREIPEMVDFSVAEDGGQVTAELVEILPVVVEEPLVIAVAVAGWQLRPIDPGAGQNREEIIADLVYALLASDGEALEVRRVKTRITPRSGRYDAVEVTPGWPRWLHDSWEEHNPQRTQSLERDEAWAYAARLNARAFAHAFAWHQVDYEILLYDDGELAAGVQLLQQGDRAGAIHHFEQLVEDNPDHASALFNLGVMLELDGQDRLALETLRRSYDIEARGRTMRHIEAIERRLDLRTDLRPRVETARETRTSQRDLLLEQQQSQPRDPNDDGDQNGDGDLDEGVE